MMETAPNRLWRYVALVAVLGNVAFSTFHERLGLGGASIAEVTRRHPNLFTPAGYAFSIWGAIYLAFIAYSVGALLPSQRRVRLHDRVAPALTLANVLCALWVVVYRFEMIGVSVALIVATLVTASVMFVRAYDGTLDENLGRVWMVPFSLFLGWVSVATIANTTVWLVSMGFDGGPLAPAAWAVILLGVAAALGATFALRFYDRVIPLVVAWAAVAIAVAQRQESVMVVAAAVFAALVSLVASGVAWSRPRRTLTAAHAV